MSEDLNDFMDRMASETERRRTERQKALAIGCLGPMACIIVLVILVAVAR